MYEICELLGIEVATFRTVATCRSVYTLQSEKSTSVNEEMLAEEATRLRDIVCKSLYNRLFTWLIKTINN